MLLGFTKFYDLISRWKMEFKNFFGGAILR